MSHQSDFQMLRERGVVFGYNSPDQSPAVIADPNTLALDAQPGLVTTPNNGIPAYLTQVISPTTIEIVFTPNKAAQIFGEKKMGDWTSLQALFPVWEPAGEVSSYGDFNPNGHAGGNMSYETRSGYFYQTILEYGEREEAMMGLIPGVNWAQKLMQSAVMVLNKFQNKSYFFGINGIACYGLLNDPSLFAPLTAATKAATGTTWLVSGAPNATANEVYNDVLALYQQLTVQTNGLIEVDQDTQLVLAMSPQVSAGLFFTNAYGLMAKDMLQRAFPNIRFETAPQYGALSAANSEGNPTGNFMQLIATSVEGQDTGSCYFPEKLRTHRIIPDLSSFKQKLTQGTWGAVITQPMAIASMIGV